MNWEAVGNSEERGEHRLAFASAIRRPNDMRLQVQLVLDLPKATDPTTALAIGCEELRRLERLLAQAIDRMGVDAQRRADGQPAPRGGPP